MSTEKRKLTRTERKQVEAAIARANQTDKKQLSAQDSIPYQRIFPDGICRVTDTFYTKTVQYQDINYQLSQNEDKTAIFEGWCDFLNYFDSSIKFQLSFLNLTASRDSYANSINIPPQGDEFDSIRAEYTEMLQNQLAKGNNGLIKTKYLTFGIEAASLKAAKPRLERIETDVINNFKRLGVVVEPLNGKERLRVLHQIFHMDGQEPFQFSWDWLAPSGLSTKDFIAPSSFSFPNGKTFCMGKKFGAVSFVQILAPELNDRMLADFLDMESSLIVNLHIQSVDQVSAIKTIKRKITDLDRAKIEEQKKAVRSGYDMDIIPSDLATYGTEAKKLLQDLQSRNERMFLLTFLVLNTADSQRQLANNVFQASSIAQKHNCQLTRLDFQQEEGLVIRLGGQVVKISPTSNQYVNPMDINLNYSDDDNPLALKADFILSLCDIVVGSKDGLQPVEKTVIDRAVRNVYRPYLADPDPEKMPILQDLYDELLRQPEPEAKRVAAALELYVTGSLNVFNHRTNVELTNRLVCFNIKELGKQLKQLGMLVIQDQVWNRVTVNRAAGKTTRYYCDEFHLLLKGELASWSVEIWKRFRKWGGIPTGITQNIKDLLASREIENIFENSDFIYMLNQASGDRQILAKQLNISPHQLSYVTHSGEGEGLLFYGNVILPFLDRFPKDTELYRIMTTKPQEVSA